MENGTPTTGNSGSASQLAFVHRLARITLAAIWFYHGLVPKIIFRDWSEMTLLTDMGLDIFMVPAALKSAAYLEIGMGALMLAGWRSRWPLWITIGAMAGALISVAQHSPQVLHAAFNPVTLNGAVMVLAWIALLTMPPASAEPTGDRNQK